MNHQSLLPAVQYEGAMTAILRRAVMSGFIVPFHSAKAQDQTWGRTDHPEYRLRLMSGDPQVRRMET
jgi:hypothetical protein